MIGGCLVTKADSAKRVRASLIVVGAGGHGKVVADTAMSAGYKVIGFVDDVADKPPLQGLDFLGKTDDLPSVVPRFPGVSLIVAIGGNAVRQSIVSRFRECRIQWGTVLHPSSTISHYARVGVGTVAMPGVVVNAGTCIGDHVILNTACSVDHDCVIEGYAHISPGAHLAGNVIVGIGAHIGAGVSIIPGCSVGSWSVIGAGASVVSDIPSGVVAVGVPARAIRAIDKDEIPEFCQ